MKTWVIQQETNKEVYIDIKDEISSAEDSIIRHLKDKNENMAKHTFYFNKLIKSTEYEQRKTYIKELKDIDYNIASAQSYISSYEMELEYRREKMARLIVCDEKGILWTN